MSATQPIVITVESSINAPVEKVWEYWTTPAHIIQWCSASADWHTPRAENDLRAGGRFSSRMQARDGSMGFDFSGVYDTVTINQYIEYTLGDGRKVKISFSGSGSSTNVVESFDAETENPIELQQGGWQAILDNFKSYTETN